MISTLALDRMSSSYENEKLEKDLELITQRIMEKSEFLLKLSTPEEWELPE